MNEQINNGGPVFPIEDCASLQFHGMTLRDYFASKAMVPVTGEQCREFLMARAKAAYAQADAMLAARGGA